MSIERMKPLILAGVAGVFSTLVLMSGAQAQEAPRKLLRPKPKLKHRNRKSPSRKPSRPSKLRMLVMA